MPIESYEDDDEEQEGPRSSFGTYLAEGDALFKQSEYKKALESYSLALELQPNDKTCLVARSKCYLKLGDPQKALQDAEDALAEDKEFNKGLYRKAEALYCMGDFEYALMYYHRGHKLRPELDEFRLGIQKAQEAIDNSIGSAAKIKLENKGDLSFFTKQDDMVNKKRAGYLKPINTKKLKPLANRNKEVKPPAPSKKTVKQLLGELYSDKEYFEKLMEDEAFIKSPQNSQIYELVQGGLNYLETRTEFWRQQKPLYARKKDKAKYNIIKKKTKPSISKYVLKQLQEVDQALSSGNSDRSLRLAQKLLKSVEGMNKEDLPNKMEVIANIHSCIGNAYIEMEQLTKALRHHEKDLQMSKQSKLIDGVSRALDNVGRVHARMGNFKKAVASWNEKLPLVKAALESTWLYHEIGRCYLELGSNKKALEFGQKSLVAGKDCEDQIWQLNATVLIGQSQVKLGNVDDAIETFSDGLELAASLGDSSAQSAISKALGDLQRRSSQASGRNTSRSEDEGSPRIKSDMDERAEADLTPVDSRSSSRKNSPKILDDGDKISEPLPGQNEVGEVQGDSNEERTGDELESDTIYESNDDIATHVNLANGSETTDPNANEVPSGEAEEDQSGAERDPRANEVLRQMDSDQDPVILQEEDDKDINKVSATDDKSGGESEPDKSSTVDKNGQGDTHTIADEPTVEENQDEADQPHGKEVEGEDAPKEDSATKIPNVTAVKSYVESDQPLTTGDLNRQSSAEQLDSVDMFYSESAENVISQNVSIANVGSLAESIDCNTPAVSKEIFISPIISAENVSSEEIVPEQVLTEGIEAILDPVDNIAVVAANIDVPTEDITPTVKPRSLGTDDLTPEKDISEQVTAEATENISSVESAEDVTASEDVPVENVTSPVESAENLPSPTISTDNVISTNESTEKVTSENVTTLDTDTEDITSYAQSVENMESLAESTENVPSPRESAENITLPTASIENVSAETSSEVVVDQVSLAQDTLHLASSTGSVVGDEGTNNVTQDSITTEVTPRDGEDTTGAINSEVETAPDLSQASNIEELPMDSSRATPDITSDDTVLDTVTADATSGGITEGAPDATTTEDVPQDISQATLDSAADDIPRDISQTTVESSFEEETPRDLSQDSPEVSTTINETTEDVSQITDEENTSKNDSTFEDTSHDITSETANVPLPDDAGTDTKNES